LGDLCEQSPSAPVPPPSPRRWLPALAVGAVIAATLVALGTSPVDLGRYAGYLCWAVVLPGTLVYRALRSTPHSLVDDLAMGTATGLVLEIGAVLLAGALGVSGLIGLWPALVVVPFAAVPSLRRHWRPRGYRRAPVAWAWAVAAVAVFMFGYLAAAYLRPNQPVPVRHPQLYLIDTMYSLSLLGEVKHHVPPMAPSVAGEPLRYHWFAFGHLATGSTISGVDAPVVLFRLGLPELAVLAVILLAVAGWRISGRPWVGAVAAALTYAIGELLVPRPSLAGLGAISSLYSWAGPSLLYGTVLALPAVVLICERLRGAVDRRGWLLLALFAFALPGAKSSELPVLLVGVAAAGGWNLVRRRSFGVALPVGGLLLAAQATAVVVLYRFESYGLSFGPLFSLRGYLAGSYHRPLWKESAVVGFAVVGYALFMGARLAGVPVLLALRGRELGPVEAFLFGAVAGGFAGTLLLSHVAWAQLYFVIAGWPSGAILSACGLVALVERERLGARTVAALAATGLALSVPVAVAGERIGRELPDGGIRDLLPVACTAAVLLATAGVCAGGLLALRRWYPSLRGTAPVAALCVVLAAGLPRLAWDAHANPNMGTGYHVLVSPERVEAARWLRANSRPDDLIATNVHRVSPAQVTDWSLSFWVAAFTERRVLVESWGYTSRSVAAGVGLKFWDQQLLADNDAAIYATTPGRVAWLRARRVRWILVDRRYGRESPELARLATLRWQSDEAAVYRL
jgi:hypothetical protein